MADALETLLRRFPSEAAAMLLRGGVLAKLLVTAVELDESDRGGAGGGIGGPPPAMDDQIMVHYIGLLARVMLTAPDQMGLLLASPGVSDGSPAQVQARLMQLVDLWLKRFDALATSSSAGPWKRKLVALALVSLLPTDPALLQRLDLILSVCVDVLAETHDPGVAGSPSRAAESEPATVAQSDRYTHNLRTLLQGDPVQTLDLGAFLQQKMGEAQVAVGPTVFQQALGAVDPVIMQQLQPAQPRAAGP